MDTTTSAQTPLDPTAVQPVEYCVPLWLRDQQVRAAVARDVPRLQYEAITRADRIAVVCFGPSLQDTWEQIRGFPFIISCSGAHKFLLERGLVPTWHVEVDPRAHKVLLLGPPHPDVQYLIASACHEAVFDHLATAQAQVKLWHVFSAEPDVHRFLPPNEWALTGGASVGLRALVLARFLGFTELHIFGMDGCARPDATHAAPHPKAPQTYRDCVYGGQTYRTTPSLLECARQTAHELDQLPDVCATFYGDGLVQAMMRDYTRQPLPLRPILATARPELISAEYRRVNADLHRTHLAYGVGGEAYAATVREMAAQTQATSVLDYGCGKGLLAKALPFPIWEYDPAVPEKRESPRAADLVVCTDVLEHVEPDKLMFVLDDLRRCVKQIGYFTISTVEAYKTLPDGRNTHLIVKDAAWWRHKLEQFFTIGTMIQHGSTLHVVVGAKDKGLALCHTVAA
jgi:hypothetical protein